MSLLKLLAAIKGGSGSGNFGHSGRPGKIGGSAGGAGAATNALIAYNKSGTDLERHITVDSAGNAVFDIEGQPHAVTMSANDAAKLDALNGDFVDLHNHPNNNAPSSADYDGWLRFQPKEARVITKGGTYILKPKDGVWFPGTKKDNLYGAGAGYFASYNYYQSHGMKYPEGNSELLSKNVLDVLSKQGWLTYEYIPH